MREPRPTREAYDKLKLEVELLREERDFLRAIRKHPFLIITLEAHRISADETSGH
jgi:hypothetical protein